MISSARTIKTEAWCVLSVAVIVAMVMVEVAGLNGDHVCMVQQKYNITKRVKYRAPMSVRTYEWCFSMPPRCSKWSTEMRDLTRLETEERTAEVAVCCPGYKMKDVSCVPVCLPGRTGNGCSEECPKNKWGPNCVNECKRCTDHGACSPVTGECRCQDGWQGERCDVSPSTPSTVEELSVTKPVTKSTSQINYESATSTTIRTTTSTKAPTTTPMSVPTTTVTEVTTKAFARTAAPTIPAMLFTSMKPITTTIRPIATTVMTNLPTSTVETTLQSSKIATIEAKNTLDWNNLTTPWTLSTYKSVAPTQPSLSTVSPVFTKLSTTREFFETTTVSTKSTTVRKIIPTESPMVPMESTKTIDISTTTFKAMKPNLITDATVKEATRRPETTIKIYPTTIKFKPKEIWIRPAQKGELSVETKAKSISEPPKHKSATKKDITTNTTPRTIMVSIIPTSLSYATFKKIALTTSSYFTHKTVTGKPSTETFTRLLSLSTLAPVQPSSTTPAVAKSSQNVTAFKLQTPFTKETKNNATNSMSTNANKQNSSYLTTISSTNSTPRPRIYKIPSTKTYTLPFKPMTLTTVERVTEQSRNATINRSDNVAVKTVNTVTKDVETNVPKKITTVRPNNNVTEEPEGEETFHILTEPEHITAVMGEKGTERSSVDLISVISIAGGVMMTVITVAVVIVMLERCKRPRYEDAKMNNIRMQVMIDNNDGPPPYVRSIFNTPLPDPPRSEKCHYQPISTLDRNLKQFMRPVVVQTISPMMLENFRGILECHYDHLPRRSAEFPTLQSRFSIAPSLGGCDELRQQRPDSLAESTIEALKCEAKLDVIDNTTSEPLYAEIPCWRPPSEHAIEIVNLNGEAVTEL